MFDNIGRKIRMLARIICLVGLVISGIAMITIWITGGGIGNRGGFTIFIFGLVVGVIGCLGAWMMSLVLFGFGKLVDDVEGIRHNTEDTQYCVDALRRLGEEYRRARERPTEDPQE